MKIKNILISQPKPNGYSPYEEIIEKYGLNIDFIPFIRVEGLSAKDFRAQRVNVLDHGHYFYVTFCHRLLFSLVKKCVSPSRIP